MAELVATANAIRAAEKDFAEAARPLIESADAADPEAGKTAANACAIRQRIWRLATSTPPICLRGLVRLLRPLNLTPIEIAPIRAQLSALIRGVARLAMRLTAWGRYWSRTSSIFFADQHEQAVIAKLEAAGVNMRAEEKILASEGLSRQDICLDRRNERAAG